MARTPHKVVVAPDQKGVLIFHLRRNKIPEGPGGVQVIEAGGGTSAPKGTSTAAEKSKDEALENARLGFDSFLGLCSISGVIVSHVGNEHCRIYVNFQSWELWEAENPGRGREEFWYTDGNPYKLFLRGLFNETYKVAKIRREGNKLSVRFSAERAERSAEAKILFTGERSAVAAAGGSNTLHLPMPKK